MKIRIFFVFFHFLPNIGGTEKVMFQYAQELVSRGHEVTILTTNSFEFELAQLKHEEVVNGIFVRRFNVVPMPYRYFFFAPSLISALLNSNADIIQVFSLLPSFFLIVTCLLAKIKKIPLILYPQYHPHRSSFYSGFIERTLGLFFDRTIGIFILRMADSIIALTQFEANFYKKHGIQSSKVVPQGVSKPKSPSQEELRKFRQKYGLGDSDKILFSLGRVERRKGFHFLILALPRILKRIPQTKLLIVGSHSNYLSKLVDLTIELGCDKNVFFIGSVDDLDLACAYAVADVVVVPSIFEAYGRVVVEAWAHKKAVVASKTIGIAELISRDNGTSVDCRQAELLAEAIVKLLENQELALKMGMNGYELAKEFTWEKAVDEIERTYKLTLKRTQCVRPTSLSSR